MPAKGDWLVAVVVCLLALLPLLFLLGKAGGTAVVRVDGREAARLDLRENGEHRIETTYGTNLLVVKDGAVSVSEADCADRCCCRQGAIRQTGQSIACLPHRLSVVVEGEEGYDAVAK